MRNFLTKSIITKYLLSFLLISFLLTNTAYSLTQEPTEAPRTLEEAESLGERILFGFPEALKKPWEEALVIWGKIANWFRGFWNSYILPLFQSVWYNISSFLGKEVERRKPEIKEEFEKEKKEMKEEIKVEVPKIGESIWQRFKELIK